jgi:serine protease AprX
VSHAAATVGARRALQLGLKGAGVGVVIDSGITPWHDDFRGRRPGRRVTAFVDFVNGRRRRRLGPWHASPASCGNGMTPRTREAMMRRQHHRPQALDGEGKGRISNIIAAIDWAVANKINIRVINMSLGAGVFRATTPTR